MDKDYDFNMMDIYKAYLRERRCCVSHPIKIGSKEALENRNDYSFFHKLYRKFREEGFKKNDIRKFMKANRLELKNDFTVVRLVEDSAFSRYHDFLEKGGGSKSRYLIYVNQRIRYINNEVSDDDKSVEDYFFDGVIPTAALDLRSEKIDDAIAVHVWLHTKEAEKHDFDMYDKRLRSFLGNKFYENLPVVRSRLKSSEKLRNIIEQNLELTFC